MGWLIAFILGLVLFCQLINWASRKDRERNREYGSYNNISNNSGQVRNNPSQKRCPYCYSFNFQYAGQSTLGAKPAKTKTKYTVNVNPLKPFTIMDSKEKVIRKAKPGFSVDEFICLNCGRRFR